MRETVNCLDWMSGILRQAANLTRVDNQVTCLGLLIFQRFARKEGFGSNDFRAISVASLYLAAKITDKHVRLSKLIIMYFMTFQLKIVNKKRNLNLMKNSRLYAQIKARVLAAEMVLLRSMGFELYSFIKTAHIYLMYLYKNLKFSRELFELAWKSLNDIYGGFLVSVLPPHILAVAVVMLGYRKTEEPMPAVPWWLLYELREKDIQMVIRAILRFYRERKDGWNLEKMKELFKRQNWGFKEDMGQSGSLVVIAKKESEEENGEGKQRKDRKKKKKSRKKKNRKTGKRESSSENGRKRKKGKSKEKKKKLGKRDKLDSRNEKIGKKRKQKKRRERKE